MRKIFFEKLVIYRKLCIFEKTFFKISFFKTLFSKNMEFVDREKELQRLNKVLSSDKKRFVVVYGRRRLGKSTLIKRALRENDVYYEAEKNEPGIQLSLLSKTISAVYPSFAGAKYDSWDSLLMAFNSVCAEGSALVLDEFPYLVQKSPSLPSTLQRLIDSGLQRFHLIICGSSQRMMQKIVIDRSEPLYGRADEMMCLSPISVKYWRDAMKLGAAQAIEEYSVWGGVPRYWVLREGYADFQSAIDGLVLDEHALLFDEPASLFMDEVSEIAPYSSIMTALGEGNQRFSHVADAVGKKTTELSKPLSNLIDMRYICKDVPFGESESKTKKTLYRIEDPFMAFYYRFIAPNRSLLALGRKEMVMKIIEQQMPDHVSHLWERLCQNAVSGNSLFGEDWMVARRWWGRVPVFEDGKKTPVGYEDLEFDVVAESIDKKTVFVGECKWASADYADRLLQKLHAKIAKAPFVKGRKVVCALFLREAPLDGMTDCIMLPEDVVAQQP